MILDSLGPSFQRRFSSTASQVSSASSPKDPNQISTRKRLSNPKTRSKRYFSLARFINPQNLHRTISNVDLDVLLNEETINKDKNEDMNRHFPSWKKTISPIFSLFKFKAFSKSSNSSSNSSSSDEILLDGNLIADSDLYCYQNYRNSNIQESLNSLRFSSDLELLKKTMRRCSSTTEPDTKNPDSEADLFSDNKIRNEVVDQVTELDKSISTIRNDSQFYQTNKSQGLEPAKDYASEIYLNLEINKLFDRIRSQSENESTKFYNDSNQPETSFPDLEVLSQLRFEGELGTTELDYDQEDEGLMSSFLDDDAKLTEHDLPVESDITGYGTSTGYEDSLFINSTEITTLYSSDLNTNGPKFNASTNDESLTVRNHPESSSTDPIEVYSGFIPDSFASNNNAVVETRDLSSSLAFEPHINDDATPLGLRRTNSKYQNFNLNEFEQRGEKINSIKAIQQQPQQPSQRSENCDGLLPVSEPSTLRFHSRAKVLIYDRESDCKSIRKLFNTENRLRSTSFRRINKSITKRLSSFSSSITTSIRSPMDNSILKNKVNLNREQESIRANNCDEVKVEDFLCFFETHERRRLDTEPYLGHFREKQIESYYENN